MSVKAKLQIPTEIKDVVFGRTVINWDSQTIIYQYDGKSYVVEISQGKFIALKNILKQDMESISDISNVEFEFIDKP